ncbi:MAG: hypothetical protein ABFD60_11145, partial [Bryobacteraceae bacterium]
CSSGEDETFKLLNVDTETISVTASVIYETEPGAPNWYTDYSTYNCAGEMMSCLIFGCGEIPIIELLPGEWAYLVVELNYPTGPGNYNYGVDVLVTGKGGI